MPLRDTLLRAAENHLYYPYWFREIFDGATRNLIRKGKMTTSQAQRFQTKIGEAFPEAMVEVPVDLVEMSHTSVKSMLIER